MVNLTKSIEKSSSQVVREMCIKGVWKHSDININDEIGLDIAVRHKLYVMETYDELLKRPRRWSDMGELFWQLVAYSDQCATLRGKKRGHRKHFERVISPLALEHPQKVPPTDALDVTSNAGGRASQPQKRSLSMKRASAKKPKHVSSKKSTCEGQVFYPNQANKDTFRPIGGNTSSSAPSSKVNNEHEEEEAVNLGLIPDDRSPCSCSDSDNVDLK
ncbi:hypothetical protein CAEBREN_16682 [Caenorhabditis brenneri]|uniref:Uncharacterized protein n=1 Tax=Caenorhabditis brenneri TaxID=135651 RepID=G0MBG3_CAEBE|nr:hypothetical protein CAEBREN_16682 [Caenorhabditis brenneri]